MKINCLFKFNWLNHNNLSCQSCRLQIKKLHTTLSLLLFTRSIKVWASHNVFKSVIFFLLFFVCLSSLSWKIKHYLIPECQTVAPEELVEAGVSTTKTKEKLVKLFGSKLLTELQVSSKYWNIPNLFRWEPSHRFLQNRSSWHVACIGFVLQTVM